MFCLQPTTTGISLCDYHSTDNFLFTCTDGCLMHHWTLLGYVSDTTLHRTVRSVSQPDEGHMFCRIQMERTQRQEYCQLIFERGMWPMLFAVGWEVQQELR